MTDPIANAVPGELNNSRAHFEPLGFTPAGDDELTGSSGHDHLVGDPLDAAPIGLPGALAFWRFDDGGDGSFEDSRGGPSATAYRLENFTAQLQVPAPTRAGPDGSANGALVFDGEHSFGFIEHTPAMEVTQGTVTLWVQPDAITHKQQIILSKDQSGSGEGGHFRLGHDDEGRIFLRFAEGDGGSNKAWVSSAAYLSEGQWSHLAVSFTETGITVFVDGAAIPDFGWYREEGNLDSPALASEAYLLQNREPWILGADTSRTEHNDTAAEFATDDEHLDDAFAGAIADFGLWGGFTPADALDAAEVVELYSNGPGTALSTPAGAQPIPAGDDRIAAGAGNDHLQGGAGNDELLGQDGDDFLEGGYGDDILDGGEGDDVLEGGRGSDLLIGGAGDDILTSRSDGGEQRIGQLVIGQPTRPDPDNEVNPERQKLYGWEDQPLIGDDILIGGEGNDTFLFNPQINAKRDIILKHVNDDRTIDWADVAGENNEQHDHWVDLFGIDIVGDYRAGEDTIAIIGHTVNPVVSYKLIDTDGDGAGDELISIVSVYSNQGGGGGAHTQDLIGQIIVRGDQLDADDLVVDAGVTHGIVETVDQLQEALAPTGELKTSTLSDGSEFIGYDSRDDQGNLGELIENPELFSDNPFLDSDRFEFATNVPEDVPAPVAVIDAASHPQLAAMAFSGNTGDYVNIEHQGRASALAQTTGTIAFSFIAHEPGSGNQTLFSKDARNYEDGGHLTAWVNDHSDLVVRYQSTDQSVYLKARDFDVEPGQQYHFAFSFDADGAALYVDGELKDTEALDDKPAFANGMLGNDHSLVFGASAVYRPAGTLEHLKDYFDGQIADVVALDRALYGVEAYKLSLGVLDIENTGPLPATPAPEPADPDQVLRGGHDDDELIGGSGDDHLGGSRGNDRLIAGAGEDTLLGGSGDDYADGGADDDHLRGGLGHDILLGGDGDDDLAGADGDDLLMGGLGADRIRGNAGKDEIHGGDGADDIIGGLDDDLVHGGAGNDFLRGAAGNDTLRGEAGDDDLRGNKGHDDIDGGTGEDYIAGGSGSDTLHGGADNDLIRGGAGADTISGDAGDDDLHGNDGNDAIDGGLGNDTVFGGRGADELEGGAGEDRLRGGSQSDRLTGGAGDDSLQGNSGKDVIIGGAGSDEMRGGSDDDILLAGAGNDVMFGGDGDDKFVFDSLEAESLGLDEVRGFRGGSDQLLISSDLSLQVVENGPVTRLTLTDAGNIVVSEVDVYGSLDVNRDIVRIDPGDSLDLIA